MTDVDVWLSARPEGNLVGLTEDFIARYRKEYDFYDQSARLVAQSLKLSSVTEPTATTMQTKASPEQGRPYRSRVKELAAALQREDTRVKLQKCSAD